MKIKTKHEIEYWLTRSKTGKLIRVYRNDSNENPPYDTQQNPFDVPIMVEFTGQAEGIADILEGRIKLKEEIEYLSRELTKAREEISESFRNSEISRSRKWYQIWKK